MQIIKKLHPEFSLILSFFIALFIPFISSKNSLPLGINNNDIHSNMFQQIIGMIRIEYIIAYFVFLITLIILRFFPLKFDIKPIILVGLIFVVRQFLVGMENETSIGLHIETKAGPAYYLLILGILCYMISSIKISESKLLYILPGIIVYEPTLDLIFSTINLGIYSLVELLKPLFILLFFYFQLSTSNTEDNDYIFFGIIKRKRK